jgi:hypothetical protein
MPTSSNRFNWVLGVLLGQFATLNVAYSQIFELNETDFIWLGERIFANECAAEFDCLTSWNQGEDFPSLGIGHFIWFPQGEDFPFEETFPSLLASFQADNIKLPSWINSDSKTSKVSEIGAPWKSRDQFYSDFNSAETIELRNFLADTKPEQINFIVNRLSRSLDDIVATFPMSQQATVREKLSTLAQSHPPYGSYALIDYVHFKGTGLTPSERYENQGWGLQQVIEEMESAPTTLYSFVQAAKHMLSRRVANAPIERNEQRWHAGWHKRVESYLPPP